MLRSPEGVRVRGVSSQCREVCETKMEWATDALGERGLVYVSSVEDPE